MPSRSSPVAVASATGSASHNCRMFNSLEAPLRVCRHCEWAADGEQGTPCRRSDRSDRRCRTRGCGRTCSRRATRSLGLDCRPGDIRSTWAGRRRSASTDGARTTSPADGSNGRSRNRCSAPSSIRETRSSRATSLAGSPTASPARRRRPARPCTGRPPPGGSRAVRRTLHPARRRARAGHAGRHPRAERGDEAGDGLLRARRSDAAAPREARCDRAADARLHARQRVDRERRGGSCSTSPTPSPRSRRAELRRPTARGSAPSRPSSSRPRPCVRPAAARPSGRCSGRRGRRAAAPACRRRRLTAACSEPTSVTGRRFTCSITSPGRMPASAAGPDGSTSDTSRPCFDSRCSCAASSGVSGWTARPEPAALSGGSPARRLRARGAQLAELDAHASARGRRARGRGATLEPGGVAATRLRRRCRRRRARRSGRRSRRRARRPARSRRAALRHRADEGAPARPRGPGSARGRSSCPARSRRAARGAPARRSTSWS